MRELQLKFITNTITERWMRILNVIEQQNMFTIVGLSQQLGVSKRTILKDVSELKNYFEESAIFESNTTGYFFKEKIDDCIMKTKKHCYNRRFGLKLSVTFFMES